MSVQELADSATQSLRAKQINSAMQDSQLKQSIQETMETRVQAAMSGNDEWRSGSGGAEANNASRNVSSKKTMATPLSPSSLLIYATKNDASVDDDISNVNMVEDHENENPTVTGTSGSAASPSSLPTKRSINADAGSRMTTNRPKVPKPVDDAVAEAAVVSSIVTAELDSEGYAKDSPRHKAPSVLELLKANVGSTVSTAKSSVESSAGAVKSRGILFKMVSSSGNMLFSVLRPNVPPLDCVGITSDR